MIDEIEYLSKGDLDKGHIQVVAVVLMALLVACIIMRYNYVYCIFVV